MNQPKKETRSHYSSVQRQISPSGCAATEFNTNQNQSQEKARKVSASQNLTRWPPPRRYAGPLQIRTLQSSR